MLLDASPPMGSDDDDSSDGERQAELDVELNKKVAKVMAPLMKKLRKQAKKIEALEEQVQKQGEATATSEPRQDAAIRELRASIDEGLDRCRRDVGDRVLHADHARVEVAVSSGLDAIQRNVDDMRTRIAQLELHNKTLQARLEDSDGHARRGLENVEERVAALRTTVSDENVRADSRRSELQLHIAEVSAKLHAELVEARRETDQELHKLNSGLATAAKRAEVLERFAALEEAAGSTSSSVQRHTGQLQSLEERTTEAEGALRTRAASNDLEVLREHLDQQHALTASAANLAAAVREAQLREAQWERRHLAVEHSATSTMREARQLAANIEELGSRLSEHALVGDIDELKERMEVLSHVADKESLEQVVQVAKAAASQESLDKLAADVQVTAAGLQALVEGTNARFEKAADAETARRLDALVKEVTRQLDSKLSISQADKLLEHKADLAAFEKLSSNGQGAATDVSDLMRRVEAAEAHLHSARRDASDAIEHARSSAASVSQLQAATDKHWQVTRTAREEQTQMVKAVRALLMDAELRVNGESGQLPAGATGPLGNLIDPSSDQFGRHGWGSASPRQTHAGGGGGGGPTPPLPRVAVAAANAANAGSSCCSSPKRFSAVATGGGAFPPQAPNTDGSGVDALARRRRLLAGVNLQGGGEVPTAPPDLGGGVTHRDKPSTRTRVGATGSEPYPSLAASGVLVPLTH